MKKEQDYIQDIAEIRSMMERSSKFLSLSGWAGIMAGIYALLGAYIAYTFLNFHPDELFYSSLGSSSSSLPEVILLAITILILALGTAVFLSYKRAGKRNKKLWNPTAKLLLVNMMVPLVVGGILILFMLSKGLIGLVAPFCLLFYGLALFNAGRYTYQEVKILGLTEIILGLIGFWFVEYGLLFWALGFGVVHIIYGIHMNYKYER
jgi:uncharacterized membrane protein YidH (DUF202 family)